MLVISDVISGVVNDVVSSVTVSSKFTYFGNQQNGDAEDLLTPEGRGYSAALPWKTFDFAQANTPDGYTIKPNDGTYVYGTALVADNAYGAGMVAASRQVTFQTFDASRVLHLTSASVGEQVYTGIIFDGIYNTTDHCVEIASTAGATSLTLNDCSLINSDEAAIQALKRSMSLYINNCDFSGAIDNPILFGSGISQTGEVEYKLMNSAVDCTTTSPDVDYMYFGNASYSTRSNAYDVTILGNDIKLAIDVIASSYDVFKLTQADSYNFSNNTIWVSSETLTKGVDVAKPLGLSTYPIQSVIMDSNLVGYYSGNGFGLVIGGDENSEGYTEVGTIRNSIVAGKYYASNTPHAFSCGRSDSADRLRIHNCIATDTYVGFLMSISASAESNIIEDCLALDCYGSSYYAKGNTDATIRNNRAIVSDKQVQRNQAILSATAQGAFDNTATQFTGNTVTVQGDAAGTDWFALAGNTSADDNATWSGNIYNVPDTLSLSDNMFVIDGSYVTGTAWLAAYPTDTINFKTQAEIDAIVAAAYVEVAAAKLLAGSGNPLPSPP